MRVYKAPRGMRAMEGEKGKMKSTVQKPPIGRELGPKRKKAGGYISCDKKQSGSNCGWRARPFSVFYFLILGPWPLFFALPVLWLAVRCCSWLFSRFPFFPSSILLDAHWSMLRSSGIAVGLNLERGPVERKNYGDGPTQYWFTEHRLAVGRPVQNRYICARTVQYKYAT